jgi:hypothetical protein
MECHLVVIAASYDACFLQEHGMESRRNFLRSSLVTAGSIGLAQGLTACGGALSNATAQTMPSLLSTRLKSLTGSTTWTKVGETKLNFKAYHPQGMVRIGDLFYVSTVEIIQYPVKFPQPVGGYDRDVGLGKGHILKFDLNGNLLTDLPIGEGAVYHPGGMDFDGQNLWVPTAEYRPDSQASIYKVDPVTMKATKLFSYQDHIGGLSRNTDTNTLHGVSWGSRRFYKFALDSAQSGSADASIPPADLRKVNHEFYIDYQDNQYLGGNEMLFTGLNTYQVKPTDPGFFLGGLEIVNLDTGYAVHQIPIKLWSPVTGRAMTNNPTWFELTQNGVRGYFIPDDDDVSMYIYEAS